MLKRTLTLAALLSTAQADELKETAPATPPTVKVEVVEASPESEAPADPELEKVRKEKERLELLNSLATEKHKHETSELRALVAKLKLEKEHLNSELDIKAAKRSIEDADRTTKFEKEKAELTQKATVAKLEAERMTNELKKVQTEAALKTTSLESEIKAIETRKKRDNYANSEPKYLDNPLLEDGSLVISDRRIPFNGPVTSALADAVTERINYYNNKSPERPIFIVIDSSPGGSVMAGYRILKAMEGSEAPVYVVVKSFAASMAATITTLAEKSFVYPNAIILHHQISQTFFFRSLNLTDQKEQYEDLKKWWNRLAGPVARKMGITADEFVEMMYEKTVSGDWTEFGDDAVKIKWADHVVTRIHETSLLKDPSAETPKERSSRTSLLGQDDLVQAVDEDGNPYLRLPRRHPKDVYMMYNPDGYYRFK